MVMSTALPSSHPGAEELWGKGFSVNKSHVPTSRSAVDITIDYHAKSNGGIFGFSRNHTAYYKWCLTRHATGSYHQATLALSDLNGQECCLLKDLRSSQILQSEEDSKEVIKAFGSYGNPFAV